MTSSGKGFAAGCLLVEHHSNWLAQWRQMASHGGKREVTGKIPTWPPGVLRTNRNPSEVVDYPEAGLPFVDAHLRRTRGGAHNAELSAAKTSVHAAGVRSQAPVAR